MGGKKAFGNIDHYNWNHIFFVLNLFASVNWNCCWEELIQSVSWCSWKMILSLKLTKPKKKKMGRQRGSWGWQVYLIFIDICAGDCFSGIEQAGIWFRELIQQWCNRFIFWWSFCGQWLYLQIHLCKRDDSLRSHVRMASVVVVFI